MLGMWWFRFCVERAEKYRARGERTAAMIFWAMRDWEDRRDADALALVTEEGFEEEVSKYLDYKRLTTPQEFDYEPPKKKSQPPLKDKSRSRLRNKRKKSKKKRRRR